MTWQPNRRHISAGSPDFAFLPRTLTSRSALAFMTVVYARKLHGCINRSAHIPKLACALASLLPTSGRALTNSMDI